jgi:excisionase family DNA binding protein
VAARLNCNKALVYRLVEHAELAALRLGGRGCSLRIAEADLDDWLYSEPPGEEQGDFQRGRRSEFQRTTSKWAIIPIA